MHTFLIETLKKKVKSENWILRYHIRWERITGSVDTIAICKRGKKLPDRGEGVIALAIFQHHH